MLAKFRSLNGRLTARNARSTFTTHVHTPIACAPAELDYGHDSLVTEFTYNDTRLTPPAPAADVGALSSHTFTSTLTSNVWSEG